MKNITQGQKEQYKEITKDLLKTTTAKNQNLHKAKQVKNDEFYTQIEDIEKELQHYKQHLKGKVVYCNCDDPEWSNFFGFFSLNFKKLGLKKLITTHYTKDSTSYKLEMINEEIEPVKTNLKEDGDFRSKECLELLKEADIVITNPPFSLFREFIDKLTEYNKKFLIIGGKNALTNKNTFKLFQENKIRTGVNEVRNFLTPNNEIKRVITCWFTNLEYEFKKQIKSMKTFKGNEENYPKYDNYDAIEVSELKKFPIDYCGIMGVPITYLEKHDPEKYELISTVSPYLDGKQKYKRVFIRKIKTFNSNINNYKFNDLLVA
ncbi:adenine-specific methyltransferase EcoRI family protein [Aliarcobacter butzleri]|uniref:adenine-specific methyltransferase EcoRI family protein n=1 Tax=Aliarcobacter butzleri TaxID=28197 RepID=UPI0024DEA3E1|nr:adenine-specific methyltransferase EcoRI family protein [Aliarcobacter butzleri]MDK2063343.1 adenine-specific methyltransferase EcoRI family protein [Aliarcobacter butzleri]